VHTYDHIDLPPIKPVTTRVNLHRGCCPGCGQHVTATPPADLPPGRPFGPGISALVVYLHTSQMVSFNRLIEMLDGLFCRKRPLTTAVTGACGSGLGRVKHTVLIHVVMDGKRHGGRDHFDGRAAASLA